MKLRTLATALALSTTAGCLGAMTGAAYTPPDPAQQRAQQRAAFAQSMGYPTKKSADDLDRTIAEQTQNFKQTGRTGETRLEAPEPFTFDGVSGTCYTVVMHLGDGATWGVAGDALKFDFKRPEIGGSGGPGVVGPGAVASVGCAESTGPITLTMAPMLAGDPIGQGPVKMQLYTHVLTRAEKQHLEEDKQRQIAEQRDFAARQAERDAQARRERDAEFARAGSSSSSSSSGSSSSSSSSPAGPVSVTIRSACGRTVPVFYGDKPKYGSGTQSSISTNSVSSHSFRDGDMMWVLDEGGNGVGSITISQGVREIEIDSSCTRISRR
jgi:hypothetical protein